MAGERGPVRSELPQG
jgi:hypothetical protein